MAVAAGFGKSHRGSGAVAVGFGKNRRGSGTVAVGFRKNHRSSSAVAATFFSRKLKNCMNLVEFQCLQMKHAETESI